MSTAAGAAVHRVFINRTPAVHRFPVSSKAAPGFDRREPTMRAIRTWTGQVRIGLAISWWALRPGPPS